MKTIILLTSILVSINICAFEIKNANKLITQQKGMFWCWAATIEAVNKYENKKLPQEKVILKHTRFSQFDLTEYQMSPAFMMPIDDYLNVLSKYQYKPIPQDSIEKQLQKNKPVIYLANNHTSVIVGFTSSTYKIMDTSFGKIIELPKEAISTINMGSYLIKSIFLTKG